MTLSLGVVLRLLRLSLTTAITARVVSLSLITAITARVARGHDMTNNDCSKPRKAGSNPFASAASYWACLSVACAHLPYQAPSRGQCTPKPPAFKPGNAQLRLQPTHALSRSKAKCITLRVLNILSTWRRPTTIEGQESDSLILSDFDIL